MSIKCPKMSNGALAYLWGFKMFQNNKNIENEKSRTLVKSGPGPNITKLIFAQLTLHFQAYLLPYYFLLINKISFERPFDKNEKN